MSNKYIKQIITFIKNNYLKFFAIILLHVIINRVLNFPYINIIKIYFIAVPYFIDWVVLLFFFRPKKELLLLLGAIVWFIGIVSELVVRNNSLELASQIVFLIIISYVFMAIKEVKKWD